MPADNDRESTDDLFDGVGASLAGLRATLQATRSSSLGGKLGFGKRGANDPDPARTLIDALENGFAEARKAIKAQNARIAELERESRELGALADGFRELRGRLGHIESELLEAREKSERSEAEAAERLAKIEAEGAERLAKIDTELREELDQLSKGPLAELSSGQSALTNELRERIQQILDEQRVCIRQLSLKTSEEAVLADRARRALELRLDALEGKGTKKPAE
ncbi:MAG TPA: hypothetical protein VM940_07130 [Chthoniobacterales bacterium]|jgi:chromosome segregation ATPase|nr:hypothetical protein [Chthoniobacterales bacterium]